MHQPLIGRNQPHVNGLRELGPLTPNRRFPWWIIIPLLLLALLIPLLLLWPSRHGAPETLTADQLQGGKPETLTEGHLIGARSPVPISVIVILDDSGSFDQYAQMRIAAMNEVAQWATKNLRTDDFLTMITFAGTAAVTLPAMSIAELAANGPAFSNGSFGDGTRIQPALAAAVTAAPTGMVSTLVVVTDTLIMDGGDPAALQDYTKQLNVVTMSVITPSGIGISPDWQQAFSWEAEFHANPDNATDIALAVGQALAHATGQQLGT